MNEQASTPTRFVGVVGWLFLIAAALGLFTSAGQVVVLSRAAPGFAVDRIALATVVGLAGTSLLVAVVALSFLRRRRWARTALSAIAGLGMAASLMRLVSPAPEAEPPPPGASAEYLRMLRLVAVGDIVVPLAACLVLGWLLWRLRSPAVRDQFH